MDFSLRQHPVQGFQWGDYSAKPEHDYTYRVVALGGAPGDLSPIADDRGPPDAPSRRTTASTASGSTGESPARRPSSSASASTRLRWTPRRTTQPSRGSHAASARRSCASSREAADSTGASAAPSTSSPGGRGCGRWPAPWPGGADVSLVVHGRDSDRRRRRRRRSDRGRQPRRGARPKGSTASSPGGRRRTRRLAAQQVPGADPRRRARGGVDRVRRTSPKARSSATSTSATLIRDPAVARAVPRLLGAAADQPRPRRPCGSGPRLTTRSIWPHRQPAGLTAVFSPRATKSTLLDWYATLLRRRVTSSAHITGAFGLNKVFRDELAVDRDAVRTVLLTTPGRRRPDPHRATPTSARRWGNYLHHALSTQWAAEQLTGFNKWVKFIHTKIILVDPLTDAPTVLTGSANYSDGSTTTTRRTRVVIRGRRHRPATRPRGSPTSTSPSTSASSCTSSSATGPTKTRPPPTPARRRPSAKTTPGRSPTTAPAAGEHDNAQPSLVCSDGLGRQVAQRLHRSVVGSASRRSSPICCPQTAHDPSVPTATCSRARSREASSARACDTRAVISAALEGDRRAVGVVLVVGRGRVRATRRSRRNPV